MPTFTQDAFRRTRSAPARTLEAWGLGGHPFLFTVVGTLFAGCGPDVGLEDAMLLAGR